MSTAVQNIIDYTAETLEGVDLQFAIVLWKPGLPNGPDSVGIFSPVEEIVDTIPVLETTIQALEAQKPEDPAQ